MRTMAPTLNGLCTLSSTSASRPSVRRRHVAVQALEVGARRAASRRRWSRRDLEQPVAGSRPEPLDRVALVGRASGRGSRSRGASARRGRPTRRRSADRARSCSSSCSAALPMRIGGLLPDRREARRRRAPSSGATTRTLGEAEALGVLGAQLPGPLRSRRRPTPSPPARGSPAPPRSARSRSRGRAGRPRVGRRRRFEQQVLRPRVDVVGRRRPLGRWRGRR